MSKKRVERRASRKGGFAMLHREILDSPAYVDLTPLARSLFVEFLRIFTPSRNGSLSISVNTAASRLGVNKDTASKAFHELAAHGFIDLTEGSLWQSRVARRWRLTTEMYEGREPTDEWKSWRDEESRSENVGPIDPEFGTNGRRWSAESPLPNVLADAARL